MSLLRHMILPKIGERREKFFLDPLDIVCELILWRNILHVLPQRSHKGRNTLGTTWSQDFATLSINSWNLFPRPHGFLWPIEWDTRADVPRPQEAWQLLPSPSWNIPASAKEAQARQLNNEKPVERGAQMTVSTLAPSVWMSPSYTLQPQNSHPDGWRREWAKARIARLKQRMMIQQVMVAFSHWVLGRFVTQQQITDT